ncbi:peptidyl-dipeptidase Dcp, partial [Angomonas deanei]
MCASNTTPEMQKLQEAYAATFAAHIDRIFLDEELYGRVHSVFLKISELSGEEAKLTDYYEKEFCKAGANLPPNEKEEIKKINERLASLEAAFGNLLLAAREDGAVFFDSADDLAGLEEEDINKAREDAERLGHNGKFALILTNTTQQPITAFLHNQESRKKIFEASTSRAEQKGGLDTRPLLEEIANLRLDKAHLCGKECFTDYVMQDRMATQETAIALMEEMGHLAEEKFEEELAEVRQTVGVDKVEPWDWLYYSEQTRKTKYDIDENKLSEYFELNSVLEKGVFYVAENLYGLKFCKTTEFPVYQEDVTVYKVLEESGEVIALFYLDPFSRSNKQGGAWMSNFVEQTSELGQKPVVVNVTNFPKPKAGRPCLLTFRNVVTLFHEFGHGLHGMLSKTRFRSLSGTSVARDFLEFPSQI